MVACSFLTVVTKLTFMSGVPQVVITRWPRVRSVLSVVAKHFPGPLHRALGVQHGIDPSQKNGPQEPRRLQRLPHRLQLPPVKRPELAITGREHGPRQERIVLVP